MIDAILGADKVAPPKQRHTALRIFERLKTEHGYDGGCTGVRDYARIAEGACRAPLARASSCSAHGPLSGNATTNRLGWISR